MGYYPIFFYPRSGSTVVDRLLDQHPEMIALDEPFWPTRHLRRTDTDIHFENFMSIINGAMSDDRRNKTNASFQYCTEHLKQFINNVTNEQHFSFIQDHFNKLIVVRRKNLLKQFASWVTADVNGNWHWHNHQHINFKKIKLPLMVSRAYLNILLPQTYDNDISLIDFLTAYEHYINQTIEYLKNSGIDWLDIVYEDHIEQDPTIAIKMIEEFLQLTPYNQYTIPLKKISNSLNEDLINFEEIADYIKGTKHEWMLL